MHKPNNHKFLIALGSNISLGSTRPLEIIKRAIVELSKSDVHVVSLSRFYETPAYPEGSGPNFINSVVKAEAKYSSQQLLQKLHEIEERFDTFYPNTHNIEDIIEKHIMLYDSNAL